MFRWALGSAVFRCQGLDPSVKKSSMRVVCRGVPNQRKYGLRV